MKTSNLLSHPDRLLEEHVQSVIEIALTFFEKENINDPTLKDILTIITFSHDIGKSTQFFQKYIRGDKSLEYKEETKHSLLGGVVGLILADRYLKQKNIDNPFLLSLAFILPKRHHSNLKDFYEESISLTDEKIQILKNQINSIDREKFQIFFDNLNIPNKDILQFSFEEIDFEYVKQLLKKVKKFFRKELKNKKSLDYYINTVLLFSLLLDGDKSDVGIKTDKNLIFKDIELESEIVDRFIENLPKDNSLINQLRKKAYTEVSNKGIDVNQRIYTLTLPTGLGKTLISFKLALKIAQKVKKETGQSLKIIYSLPFLSIIEQNFNVFENVLKHNGINPDNSIILKHHHLTGFKYKEKENEFDYDTSRILIEGWNSKIITTTFMQFFYSLISNKNRMLRKFHKFTNSVVILDEIQSIPHKYWLVLKEILTKMAERFNFYLIFSTATQPLIFEKEKAEEIIDFKPYFKKLNRYDIHVVKTPKTIEEFYSNLNLAGNKRYLFILNTVNAAKQLYNLLKNNFSEDIVFLSTHLVPKERLNRIKLLKSQQRKIAVSTQLVEAGVDIDFDVVYRDFAPFDSLNQSAGRCNREGKKEKGQFFVLNLKDENGRFYHSYIYDTVLTHLTQEILEKDKYEEKDVYDLVNFYYEKLRQIKSDKTSQDLLEMLYNLKFDREREKGKINSINDFVLIEEDVYKEDVFIELNEEAKEIWQEFSKIWQIPDIFERKKVFDSIKADFYQYIVSVPVKENTPKIENNFYYVPNSLLDEYYDLETGFKTKGNFYLQI
ncbi:CRISPR-associated helicase/endonuclease Cas3 [Persephonella sp. KM09-Lau-8]|uniref:CRISPR-associated helicase/endonuclease Cas3 n=1 Tax=Persephonella sp. KM09-Lau-8 TaxID=1158345 RepID=UPI00049511CB|nr:CRISPR-associated helicase/endonuclease Cas3 [Persephonella sp. KM09-Lau-8]